MCSFIIFSIIETNCQTLHVIYVYNVKLTIGTNSNAYKY